MPASDSIVENLRRRGRRLTPQRLVILQILEEQGRHLAPGEIFELAASRMPGLTEATVYRTLDFLVHNDLALVAHIGDGRMVYETAAHNHHHLICRVCGYTLNIEPELIEALYERLSAQTGFKIHHWHATFFGLCPDCAKENQQ